MRELIVFCELQLPGSLNLPGFVGCIEMATLNGDITSLYNFKHIYNLNTTVQRPCTRYVINACSILQNSKNNLALIYARYFKRRFNDLK